MSDGDARLRPVQRVLVSGLLALACLLLVTAAVLHGLSLRLPIAVTYGTQVGAVIWTLGLVTYPVMGWLIVRRDPGNRIGWLFLAIGVGAGVHLGSVGYASQGLVEDWTAAAAVGWIGNFGWILWIGMIGVLVAPLFPDGRPLSPRWRVWIGVVAAGMALGAIGEALDPRPLDINPAFMSPFGLDAPVVGILQMGLVMMPLGVLGGAVAVVLRYRRSGQLERAQLRWFVSAIVLVAIGFVLVFTGVGGPALYRRLFEDVVNLMWSAVAAAVGVAILRYRLYAIDVVINRALVYGSLTGLLVVVYLAGVALFQAVLSPITGGGDVAVAASTLLVAALFGPLRRRVQTLIDRRFYRTRYDAALLLEGFAGQLRQQVHLEAIVDQLQETAAQAVLPAELSVWVRDGGASRPDQGGRSWVDSPR